MIRTLAVALCGLMLASVMPASAARGTGQGYTYCHDPNATGPVSYAARIDCDELPQEEVARQRADTDATNDTFSRRYNEQEALPVPTTKADLTLLCKYWTVQVWLGAGLLTWGSGSDRQIWRLDRVTPTEIGFKRVSTDLTRGEFFDASAHIDRVTGAYARETDFVPPGTERGECKPAQPKF